MVLPNIWELDTSRLIKNLSWWWWWWLVFIHNPKEPTKPKQLMVLWSTKNAPRVRIDDVVWDNDMKIEKTENRDLFKGATAAWYYDGKKMDNHFILEPSDIEVIRKGGAGAIIPRAKWRYDFTGNGRDYEVIIKKPDTGMDFHITPINKGFAKIRRETQCFFGTDYGYDLTEINRADMRGRIDGKNVTGTAYLQQVRVNAPAPPWFWGINHFQDGSILTYYQPHFGLPVFARSRNPHSKLLEVRLPFYKDIKFYSAEDGSFHRLRKNRVERWFEGDLPVFEVSGKYKDMEAKFRLDSYSEVIWGFEHAHTKFFYGEYPISVTEFKFRKGNKIWSLDDLGYGYGNSEHSWGMLF